MRPLFWLCLSPAVCLGVVALTSFILFYALRRGTRSINERLQDEANNAPKSDNTAEGDLASASNEPSESISRHTADEMSACTACGGENPAGASKCAYCGRKL
jgi:hypothetical protein